MNPWHMAEHEFLSANKINHFAITHHGRNCQMDEIPQRTDQINEQRPQNVQTKTLDACKHHQPNVLDVETWLSTWIGIVESIILDATQNTRQFHKPSQHPNTLQDNSAPSAGCYDWMHASRKTNQSNWDKGLDGPKHHDSLSRWNTYSASHGNQQPTPHCPNLTLVEINRQFARAHTHT